MVSQQYCIMHTHNTNRVEFDCDNRFVSRSKGFLLLITDMQTTVSLQCVLCTFDISILHQVSLLVKIDPTEYASNLAPSRAGVLMDVDV